MRERQDALIPQLSCLLDELPGAAGVVQPHIGDQPPLLFGGLHRDTGPGVVLAEPAVFDQPLDPHLGIGVHDDDQREHRRHLGFDEQRNVLDDHRILPRGGDQLRAPSSHQWVNDAVQGLPFLLVTERDRGQRGTVQGAIGLQDPGPEGLDELAQTLGTRFDDLTGDDVAIDDDAATFGERGGHRRLAGADTAGESNT